MSSAPSTRAIEVMHSAAELQERVRSAHAAKEAIRIRGAGTRSWLHPVDARPHCTELRLSGIQDLEWIDPEDRTCRVAAGTSLAELDAELARHGLMLPWLGAAEGTVGGAFLSGTPSLCGASWGLPRDQVLGGAWVLADGRAIESGTRVVKSVAGYDLTRLFLGSRGRLAACTALTLRLRPRPEHWLRAREALAPPGPVRGSWLAVQLPLQGEWQQHVVWADPLAVPSGIATEQLDEAGMQELVLDPVRDRLRLQRCWVVERSPEADAELLVHDFAQNLGARSVPRGEGWPAPDSPWLSAVQEACAPDAIAFGG